ncbi:MAG: isoprenylcysteine carboxylmethyltransferase family protein [Candidatus Stygibacter australis]|nr:isoprenylcysteine carboxylmethyltransferase family protein [Candidatus Stygibacter australis]MDP8322673.1 isoprenylcysteine carboxylmethyltransferase family protein [Candidatus Stygibacter australis]
MLLKEQFEKSGKWLFRWRSYLPIFIIVLILVAMRHYEYLGNSKLLETIWVVFCFLVSFIGLGIRIITIGHVPRGTSGRNRRKQVADSLNTTGIYSIVRNPLYLGNFFMGLGISLFAHIWWVVLIYILVFWLYYERIICAEEEFLIKKFGDEYLNWADSTPAFFPNFKGYIKSDLSFSIRNVLKREYHGFFALIVVMFCLKIASDLYVKGKPEFDLGWIILMSISFMIWIVLRILNKHTRILDVRGR